MLKLFLSSHGHMASGIKSSVEILCGTNHNLTVFDAYVDQQCVSDALDEFYKTVNEDDQVLLLSDLYGGSVNQQMYLYLERPNTMLVAGVNLALVLELTTRTSITEEELKELVEQSRQMLRVVEVEKKEETEEQDDFF